MAETEFLSVTWFQWLGGIVVTLWMTFFGLQQRRLNQMVTHEELDDLIETTNDRFNLRREAVEQRMNDFDKRVDRMSDDIKESERRLIAEVRASEARTIAAIQRRRDE